MSGKNAFPIFGLLTAGLILLFLLLIGWGSVHIPFLELIRILAGGQGGDPVWRSIVIDFRLPKALTAILAGIALSLSGLQMQTLFRNPLAGPYVLGLSAGASLGVALLVLTSTAAGSLWVLPSVFSGPLATVAAAVLGAALVMFLVMGVAVKIRSNVTLLIVGIMFGYAASGLVSILMHFSNPEDIQAYIYWTFGSFRGVAWRQMPVLAVCVGVGGLYGIVHLKSLNALLLGETYARSVGEPIVRVRVRMLASTALLAGSVTAFCGPIGFLGIAVPHLCRGLFKTSDHRILLPGVFLIGSTVALTSELIASLPFSQYNLPLNAITSIFGAPVVIWVVLRQHADSGF